MVDFTKIISPEEFEHLCEELLVQQGLNILARSSRGPDRGADIIASQILEDNIGFRQEYRILIECKHFAKSGRSVRESDVGNIIERTISNNCNKYLLITSTVPSSSLAYQINGINSNPSIPISASYWSRHNLDKFISESKDLKDKYFILKEPEKTTTDETDINLNIIAVHLHPDFASELHDIIELWNESQDKISFIPIRPPRLFEEILLSKKELHCDSADEISIKIKTQAGFENNDGIIQFCEGRLYTNDYYQLFSNTIWFVGNGMDTATISLNKIRQLSENNPLTNYPTFSIIIQTLLYCLGSASGLDCHKVSRTCIMDFNNNMAEILLGLKFGPKFCPHCTKKLKDHNKNHLLQIAKKSKDFLHDKKEFTDVTLRMQLRDSRYEEYKEIKYDIALSFAGEDRDCAELLARELSKKGIRVFYDSFEKSKLWGEDLYSYLYDLYRFRARYCIMFLSKYYANALWTNHERKAAQARAFEENRTYILPIRIDNTEISGILPTVGYLTWDKENIDSIIKIIRDKLNNTDDHK